MVVGWIAEQAEESKMVIGGNWGEKVNIEKVVQQQKLKFIITTRGKSKVKVIGKFY